jgi:hypothetical protein
VVDLATTRLLLYRTGQPVLCAPAAVGATQSPTPVGNYFVVRLAVAPSPAYGPFVIVTSAVAQTTTDWEQSGVPVVTVEGPLGVEAAIGLAGARITGGSVRLFDPDLEPRTAASCAPRRADRRRDPLAGPIDGASESAVRGISSGHRR